MLDHIKGFVQGVVLAPIVRLFVALKISPDAVTLVGTIGVAVGALAFYPRGELLAGTIFIICFVFSDLIDGAMARMMGRTSKFGAFWDSTLDRFGDGAVFGGLALYFAGPGESDLYLALSLWCVVMGSVTSYARARAESLGFTANVGIAERADRLALVLGMTGLAGIFSLDLLIYIALWILAVASTITVGQRIWTVRKQAIAEEATS